jgi:ketosteroid isomerase-like protein
MVRAGGCVVVNALMALAGTFDGSPFDTRFRYTRVWSERADGWKIIAGHMSAVP